MRILSQDGKIDVNYGLIALVVNCKCKDGNGWFEIDMYSGSLSAKNVRMAKYSTEAKARKAMEMLREEYTFEKQFETICNGTTDYPSRPTYYFQFPQDDKAEVSL